MFRRIKEWSEDSSVQGYTRGLSLFRISAVRRTNSYGVRITRRKRCLEKLFDLKNVLVSVTTMGLMKLKLRGTLKELHTTQKEKTPVGIDLVFKVLFMIVVGRFSKRTETTEHTVQVPKYGQKTTESGLFRASSRRQPTFPSCCYISQLNWIVSRVQPRSPHTTLKIPKRD